MTVQNVSVKTQALECNVMIKVSLGSSHHDEAASLFSRICYCNWFYVHLQLSVTF